MPTREEAPGATEGQAVGMTRCHVSQVGLWGADTWPSWSRSMFRAKKQETATRKHSGSVQGSGDEKAKGSVQGSGDEKAKGDLGPKVK